jgi:8-oxo-dGTP diphosphatase
MQYVRVGVAALIFNNFGEILLGQRLNAHGANSWAPPGRHLELGGSFEECAVRETLEETGLNIGNVKYLTTTNDVFEPTKHYVTIFTYTHIKDGRIQVIPQEPLKCKAWNWFTIDNLPTPLFLSMENLLKERSLTITE